MAWRQIGDKPLSESMLTRFTDAYMRHQGRDELMHFQVFILIQTSMNLAAKCLIDNNISLIPKRLTSITCTNDHLVLLCIFASSRHQCVKTLSLCSKMLVYFIIFPWTSLSMQFVNMILRTSMSTINGDKALLDNICRTHIWFPFHRFICS